MRSPNVDSSYNWFIAVAAFLLHAVTWGLTFSFGIFYVALLKEFPGQEREAGKPSLLFLHCFETTG